MAKNIDYSKIKALSQQILECIGDDDVGANPDLPKQKADLDDGGQAPLADMAPAADDAGFADKKNQMNDEDKKKKRDSALAMMGSVLASRMK